MSRRNNLSDPSYGQIKLKCPYKHQLGVLLVDPRRPTRPQTFHRMLKAPELVPVNPGEEDGELNEIGPNQTVEIEGVVQPGQTITVECDRCGKAWQTPWEMVEPGRYECASSAGAGSNNNPHRKNTTND